MFGWITRRLKGWLQLWEPVTQPLPPLDADEASARLVRLANELRRGHNVLELLHHDGLVRAAQAYARVLADGQGHLTVGTSAELLERLKAVDYQPGVVGQCLGRGHGTPEALLRGWAAVPHARLALLEPDAWHAGFGVADGGDGRRYWCGLVAAPLRRHAHRRGLLVRLPPGVEAPPS